MIVKESLLEQKKLQLAAGLVILQNHQILLVHPTGQKWKGTYSIPKGHVEEGEDFIDTAIRETKEEIGVKINPNEINAGPFFIDYTTKKGKLYKRVYYYIVEPQNKIKQKHFKLQKAEVDWAGFLTLEEAKKRIFWRLKDVLDYLK